MMKQKCLQGPLVFLKRSILLKYMSNFCCSVIKVQYQMQTTAWWLPTPSHSYSITRCGVNLSGRLLGMQLKYVQVAKDCDNVHITIFCNLRRRLFILQSLSLDLEVAIYICFQMFIAYSQLQSWTHVKQTDLLARYIT